MTMLRWLRLNSAMFLWALFATITLVSHSSFAYDGPNQTTVGSIITYDVPSSLTKCEKKNGANGEVVLFSKIARFLAAEETTTVIGRVKDLQKLGPGEKSLLDQLPDLGSPKANWIQNSGVLRQEMNQGLPIRDASFGDNTGAFLNAERNLLSDRGWTFDRNTGFWMPPTI
jgi:hypothetical protein